MAHGDPLARVRAESGDDARRIAHRVPDALTLDRVADLDVDAGYAVQQLVDVAWTSVSTARHHASAGSRTVHALRDLFNLFASDERRLADDSPDALPVVYQHDVIADVVDAFERLAVVASESMMSQVYATAVEAITRSLTVAPPPYDEQLADIGPNRLCRWRFRTNAPARTGTAPPRTGPGMRRLRRAGDRCPAGAGPDGDDAGLLSLPWHPRDDRPQCIIVRHRRAGRVVARCPRPFTRGHGDAHAAIPAVAALDVQLSEDALELLSTDPASPAPREQR